MLKSTEIERNCYTPFGMIEPGRNFTTNIYRYGFNGKEKDDEMKGNANSLDFGARMFDPRVGRFLSPDPAKSAFSFETPYAFAGNTPIWAIDIDGEKIYYIGMNMEAVEARRMLNRTVLGKYILDYYEKSNTHDIYITVGDYGKRNVGASTIRNAEQWVDQNGKLDIPTNWFFPSSQEKDRNAFAQMFQGLDVNKSKGREISLVGLNKDVFNANNSDFDDPYLLASLIAHELIAHIYLAIKGKVDEDAEHRRFGQYGTYGDLTKDYNIANYLPANPAAKILEELVNLKKQDLLYKQKMDDFSMSLKRTMQQLNSKKSSSGKTSGARYQYMLKKK